MTQALIAGERAGFIAAGIADGPAPSPMFLTLNSGSGQIDLAARNNGAGQTVYRWEGSARSLGL